MSKKYSKNWWSIKIEKELVGRKINKVDYMSKGETNDFGWYHSAVNLYLDNGYILSPMKDDEGNDAGAIVTNIPDLETIPVWHGGSLRDED